MIAIVDTGGANIASVSNALERLKLESKLTSDRKEIENATHVILPGVGQARTSMTKLKDNGLIECIKGLKQPVMGICLGMQILFEGSEEGDIACLGILPGVVKRLTSSPVHPIPHMGWNQVEFSGTSALTDGVPGNSFFYFVHSFKAPKSEFTTGVCDYSETFPAMVQRDNFFGVQFHPERSAAAGARLLKNFVSL